MADDGLELQDPGNVEVEAAHSSDNDKAVGIGSATPDYDDDVYLRRLGKRPLLARSFGFMSMMGLACSALSTWEGVLVASVPGTLNGGPAGVVWGFLVSWVGLTSVYVVLGELASIAPTTGGQYHWVAILAPESCKRLLAYVTAWSVTLAWQAIAVAVGYECATTLQGILVLTHPDYVPQNYQTVLLIWATMAFSVVLNSSSSRLLAKFEGLALVMHLSFFLAILVPVVYFSDHNPPSAVFSTWINEGGWSTQALSFFVGFPALAGSLVGADCAVHMSEEIRGASLVVPRVMLFATLINGALGFAMIIALFFCLTDLEAALAASETMYYPFFQVFQSGLKSTAGAAAMGCLILVMGMICAVAAWSVASRMLWAFARDRAIPGHRHLAKLTANSLPFNAIITTSGICILLSVIVFGSVIALDALITLYVAALCASYLLVGLLLLWRRLTGAIEPYVPGVDTDPNRLRWGPWRVPEPLGTANNILACCYSALLLFWSFWPQETPTTAAEANWSALVFGSVLLGSIGWYFLRARHYFNGPIREV